MNTKDIEETIHDSTIKIGDTYLSLYVLSQMRYPQHAVDKALTILTQHHEAEVERALEDVRNYVDELYQNGNMDKMQAEMICEYIDGKLPAPTKTDNQ